MTSIERCALAIALLLAPGLADAQSRDDEARRRLILQAGVLRDRGDHEGSLRRLREAATRRMSPSLRLFIAQEERSLGQHLEALRDARECATEFEADPSLGHRDEFLATCRALADDVSQRVGRITVRLPPNAPSGVAVFIDGRALPRDAWGSPWELLPGRVVVEARAPGRVTFSREINVTAGASASVRVELPPGESVAPSSGASSGSGADPFSVQSARDPGDDRAGAPRSDIGRWVLLGGAGALFVAAGVFYLVQDGAVYDRDALCRSAMGGCVVANASAAREASEHQDRADTFNTLTNVSLGLGAAAAVGGVVWWIVDWNTGTRARRTTAVTVTPVGDGAVVGLRGSL